MSFPPVEEALEEPNGLLCSGGDLSPATLLNAYCHGIFPWFSPNEAILWWSPHPRMVLIPQAFKVSRSLRQVLRRGGYRVLLDNDFPAVISACAKTPRHGQAGTWISDEMQAAYSELFALGFAHCVETWVDDKLVGGLYGVAIGRMFYGESMFSWQSNASKIALAHLVHFLNAQGFGLIDCQINTPHLASLGAQEIPRHEFIERVQNLIAIPPLSGRWPSDGALLHGFES